MIVSERIELGLDRTDGGKNYVGIDPIYMGEEQPPDSRWPAQLRDSLPGPFKNSPFLAAYGAALADGTDDWVTWGERFDDGEPRPTDVRREAGARRWRRAVSESESSGLKGGLK